MPEIADTRTKRRKIAERIVLAVAIVCIGGAVLLAISNMLAEKGYDELAELYGPSSGSSASGEDGSDSGTVGWDSLQSSNPDCVAWLSVDGTHIDYPVMQSSEADPEFYLHHDFWGSYDSAGTPYLDSRADADGSHMLVYGHHLGFSTRMFSEIFRAYQQDVFDGIGSAWWTTEESGTTEFTPVMAMSVDKSYAGIQQFEFDDEEELRAWLEDLSGDASAVSDDMEEQIEGATRVLTLVTCSSTIGGQRARTLLIFVA